jgi:hypothetical protein
MISKDELRSVYTNFCKNNALDPFGDKFISNFLTRELGVSSFRFRRGEIDVYCWKGVKFKDTFEILDEYGFSCYKNEVYHQRDSFVFRGEELVEDFDESLVEKMRRVFNQGELAVESLFKFIPGVSEVELDKLLRLGVLFEVRPGVVRFVE